MDWHGLGNQLVTVATGAISGAVSGLIANYYASQSTDRRQRREAEAKTRQEFDRVSALMPDLIEKFRDWVQSDAKKLVREFGIRRTPTTSIPADQPRYYIADGEIPDLPSKLSMLEYTGFIRETSRGSVKTYRWTDIFYSLLDSAPPLAPPAPPR